MLSDLLVVRIAWLQADPIECALANDHVVHPVRYPAGSVVASAVSLPYNALLTQVKLAPLYQAVQRVDEGRAPKVGASAQHGGAILEKFSTSGYELPCRHCRYLQRPAVSLPERAFCGILWQKLHWLPNLSSAVNKRFEDH
eukprot:3275177-Pleurochrysis_carterae.AAC.3